MTLGSCRFPFGCVSDPDPAGVKNSGEADRTPAGKKHHSVLKELKDVCKSYPAFCIQNVAFLLESEFGIWVWKSRGICDILRTQIRKTILKKRGLNKMKKRLFAIFLCLVLCVMLVPVAAFAGEGAAAAGSVSPYTGDESNVALWIVVAVAALAAIVGIILYLVRRRR